MSISINQRRVNIGLFYGQVYGHISIKLRIGCCDLQAVIIVMLSCSFFFFASPATWGCQD